MGFFLLFPALLYGFILLYGYAVVAREEEKLSPFIFPLVSGAFFSFPLFFFKFMQGPLQVHVKGMVFFCFLAMGLLIWNWNQKLLLYPLWKLSLFLSFFLFLSVLLPVSFLLGPAVFELGFSFLLLGVLLLVYPLLIGLSFRPPRSSLGCGGDSLFWWIQFSFLAVMQSWSSVGFVEITLFALSLLGTRMVFFFFFPQAQKVTVPLWELFFPLLFFGLFSYSLLFLEVPFPMALALFFPFLAKHWIQLTSWKKQRKRFLCQYSLVFFPVLLASFWYSL